jgi:hypothetical protein
MNNHEKTNQNLAGMADGKKPIYILLLDIVLVIAAIAFVGIFFHMVGEIRRAYNRSLYSSGYTYYLKDGDYGEIADTYYRTHADVIAVDEESMEILRIGKYADEAFFKHVFEAGNKPDKAKPYESRMATTRSLLGEYSFTADEIDRVLERYIR